MPRFNASLNITTGRGDTLSASKSGNYSEIFNIKQVVDNSDSGIQLVAGSTTKSLGTLPDVHVTVPPLAV